MSKKMQIIAHFREHPTATPKDVGLLFGAAVSNVYNYRKEALASWADIATEAANTHNITGFVSNPRTLDYAWVDLGLYMDRNAVRGYLKGHMLLLLQGLDDTNFDAHVQEMGAVLNKLKNMKD